MAEPLRRGSGIELELARLPWKPMEIRERYLLAKSLSNSLLIGLPWKPMEMREPTHKKMRKVLFILKQSKGTVLSIPEFTALSLLLI
nr:hypothetical protein Iba_chr10fCG7970 [Ipomoea batatas]